MIKGKKLVHNNYYLRVLEIEDINLNYLEWLKDTEVTKYLEVKYETFSMQMLKEYLASFENDSTKYLFGIFNNDDSKHIGNATIYNINYKVGTFDIGYLIGDKAFWGMGAGNSVCLMLLQFGFDELALRKLFTGTYSNNLSSRFVWNTIGCNEEAKLKGKFLFEGVPIDEVIYSLDKEEWKSVKNNFGL